MDEKLKKVMLIVVGCFVVLFLFLFLLSSCQKKYEPFELELEIADEARKYYERHTEELPGDGDMMTLTLQDLVLKEIIPEVEKMLDKDTTCTGTLTIENNNDYYMYSPSITCTDGFDNYLTKNLSEELLDNVVTSGNGLYAVASYKEGETKHYFKGDNVNNILIFDGLRWRIVGVNEDGTVRIVEEKKRQAVEWDDRYNNEKGGNLGINDFVQNGVNSRILDVLNEIYETENVLSNNAKGYIRKTNLCIGKRSEAETSNNGSVECSNILENQYIGLIQFNEYLLSSLDPNCTSTMSDSCKNYNYMANFENSYWTLTADSSNTNKVYKISTTPTLSNAKSSAMPRMVINLSENTNVSGSGTEEDPYIVSGFDSELKELD